MTATRTAILTILIIISAPHALAASSADSALRALFDEYWAFEMRENPFSATSSGVSDYNHEVPQVAPEDYRRRTAARRAFLGRLDAIDAEAASADNRLSASLLKFILSHDVRLAAHRPWRIPFLADSGFHSSIGYVVSATPLRTRKDFDDYLTRLKGLSGYLDQNVENMRMGLADGFTQPQEILPHILPSFEAQVTERAEDHPLFAPFKTMPATFSRRERQQLEREAKAVLADEVIPAFTRVRDFMAGEYMEGAARVVGAGALPDGADYYVDLARYYTSLDDADPDAVHALGLREVARIRKKMDAVIKKSGFDGDFDAFQAFLRTDPQFYAKTEAELLRYAAWLAKDIDGKLPAFFGKLPRQPYSVEPVPAAIAPNYTTGRYVGAPLDADRGGQYWVNTYDLKTRPLYQLPALTLHEATPGHHLQAALSKEIEDIPAFRRQFYPHAFGEGWGLYSEKLGEEMGVYTTPYEEFGRLSYEMWRAARLVIDTGLHAKGWTRQQAIDYLAGNTALSLHNVRTEVDRYISWPGQALAYKMGELTIIELREKAEKELGDAFDIRAFHDAVLANGGVPLDVLRTEIDAFIESNR